MNYDESGQYVDMYHRSFVDLSIVIGTTECLFIVVSTALISITFAVLPPLVADFLLCESFQIVSVKVSSQFHSCKHLC